jgi:yecA family protein
MTKNLLQAPERAVIEAFLGTLKPESTPLPSYERLLGFLTGVVITPGLFLTSQWLQPLLDKYDLVFEAFEDASRFLDALMPLYNRIYDLKRRGENLCPIDLDVLAEQDAMEDVAHDWGTGLHDALALQPEIWAPEPAPRQIPLELLQEMEGAIPFLWAIADPDAIPRIAPDPVPFQHSLLGKMSDWKEEQLSESWNEELQDKFVFFCLCKLPEMTGTLQRYALAYEKAVGTGGGRPHTPQQPVNAGVKVGRNDPCPCGSGKKFKKCCGA